MTFVGADPRALAELAVSMKSGGDRLESAASEVTATLARAGWQWPDAADFTERWQGSLQASIKSAADALRGEGSKLLRQALEQDVASGSFDAGAYGDLLQGSSWSDIINGVQGAWDWLFGNGEMTEKHLGGTITIDHPENIPVDGPEAQKVIQDISQVRQGQIGDCWLISALAAVGQRDPAWIDQHINYRDGGWDVTLYENGNPVTIRVNADELVASGCRDANGQPNWMSVYEEAVAKHLGNNYRNLVADSTAHGLELITGKPTDERVLPPSPQEMAQAIADGRPITAMTDPLHPWRDDLVAAHVYVVEKVDPMTGDVTLVNPWGKGPYQDDYSRYADRVTMSYADYQANFIMTGMGGK